MTEAEFQFRWNNLYFNFSNLKTQSGKTVHIIYPGNWNSGPGPDFLQAQIRIDGIVFNGSIELHLNPMDWYRHKHQFDNAYNNTILHVCPNQLISSSFITTTNSNESIELLLIDSNSDYTERFIKPCEIAPISEETLLKQAKLANTSYLIQSVSNLFKYTHSDYGLEMSFKRASIIRLFELLGAPFQKDLFISIGENISTSLLNSSSVNIFELTSPVRNIGIGIQSKEKIEKGFKLAKFLYEFSLPSSFSDFKIFYLSLKKEISSQFEKSLHKASLTRNWAVVLSYSWASLVYKTDAMNLFSTEWQSISTKTPYSIEKSAIHKNLKNHTSEALKSVFPNFLLDQHKSYCSKVECLSCELKNNKTAS